MPVGVGFGACVAAATTVGSVRGNFKSEAMFAGDANIKYELYAGGALVSSMDKVPKNADLIIWEYRSAWMGAGENPGSAR